jgi:hypothetical protein
MRFKVPGQDINVRLFERVETVDNQYDIFDVGIEQADGSIDSMVVGGSFSYAKSLVKAMILRLKKLKLLKLHKLPSPSLLDAYAPYRALYFSFFSSQLCNALRLSS